MNQLFTYTLCLVLVLTGCNQSSPVSRTEQPSVSIPKASDQPEGHSHQAELTTSDTLQQQAELSVATGLNGKWVIQRINETDSLKYSGTPPFINISGDSSYAAYLGCNNLQGSLHVTAETLRFSSGPMTARACDPSNSESELRTGLFYEFEWSIANDTLTLISYEGQTELLLQKQP